MRFVCVSIIALSCTFAIGCFSARSSAPDSFVCQSIRNAVQSPIRDFDEAKFIKYTRYRAEKAWSQCSQNSDRCFPAPYHRGFVEGFVDYVQAGGNGEPPYLPPFRYRLNPFRSAEGVAAVEDWYAGFRHGATSAKESGLRELSYIPLPGPAAPIEPSTVNVARLAPANPSPAVEGSPWEQPGITPMPLPLPPKTDSIPTAPPPRTRPFSFWNPNRPLLPERASAPSQVAISSPLNESPPPYIDAQVSEIRQTAEPRIAEPPLVAVPLPVLAPPQIIESSVQSSVTPAHSVVLPLPPGSNVEEASRRSSEIQQASVVLQNAMPETKLPPPQVIVSSTVQSPVTPAISMIRPVQIPMQSGADPWRSAATSYPVSGAGSN